MGLTIPIVGDPQDRSTYPVCFLTADGPNRFSCKTFEVYEFPADVDIGVYVSDYALTDKSTSHVATRIVISGHVVQRVKRYENGMEFGTFRVSTNGRIY